MDDRAVNIGLEQRFAAFVCIFSNFRHQYPDPTGVSLQAARPDGNFDLRCRNLRCSFGDLISGAKEQASTQPHTLPPKPESPAEAFLWPLTVIKTDIAGKSVSLHDMTQILGTYIDRQELGHAYHTFSRLASSMNPDADFEQIERVIGNGSSVPRQPAGSCTDTRIQIPFDCPEFGYDGDQLTREVHSRMTTAHESLAIRQFDKLATQPLIAQKSFRKHMDAFRYWGGDQQMSVDSAANYRQENFDRLFPDACRAAARNEAINLIMQPLQLSGYSGTPQLDNIMSLVRESGLENLEEVFRPVEKIGMRQLTPAECVHQLKIAVGNLDAAARVQPGALGLGYRGSSFQ